MRGSPVGSRMLDEPLPSKPNGELAGQMRPKPLLFERPSGLPTSVYWAVTAPGLLPLSPPLSQRAVSAEHLHSAAERLLGLHSCRNCVGRPTYRIRLGQSTGTNLAARRWAAVTRRNSTHCQPGGASGPGSYRVGRKGGTWSESDQDWRKFGRPRSVSRRGRTCRPARWPTRRDVCGDDTRVDAWNRLRPSPPPPALAGNGRYHQ